MRQLYEHPCKRQRQKHQHRQCQECNVVAYIEQWQQYAWHESYQQHIQRRNPCTRQQEAVQAAQPQPDRRTESHIYPRCEIHAENSHGNGCINNRTEAVKVVQQEACARPCQHTQPGRPRIDQIAGTAPCRCGNVDSHRNARRRCQSETYALYRSKQHQLEIAVGKGIPCHCSQHDESRGKQYVLPLILIAQIGMKRTCRKHGRNEYQKHVACPGNGHSQLLRHYERKYGKKHVDGCEQQQISCAHPPEVQRHKPISTVLSHSGSLSSSHRKCNG